MNATFWYDASPARPTVIHLRVGNIVGPALQAGIDDNVSGHWFANLDLDQVSPNADAHVDALGATAHAHTPRSIRAGIAYRF